MDGGRRRGASPGRAAVVLHRDELRDELISTSWQVCLARVPALRPGAFTTILVMREISSVHVSACTCLQVAVAAIKSLPTITRASGVSRASRAGRKVECRRRKWAGGNNSLDETEQSKPILHACILCGPSRNDILLFGTAYDKQLEFRMHGPKTSPLARRRPAGAAGAAGAAGRV
ncbi:hypothetical protein EVAR_50863_1 [Eumeta japonica]|uniref:Uncharacterized protein n=1 Tax=Eumeta variegata TaxID=151549 RepID=A0A4C1Y889_EUMVA|nr:hypothetical protein EVAR_50863_1 [Eumeta japonica]